MRPCQDSLTELPADFGDKTVAQALEILLSNKIVDSTFYFECSRKQSELTEWIND